MELLMMNNNTTNNEEQNKNQDVRAIAEKATTHVEGGTFGELREQIQEAQNLLERVQQLQGEMIKSPIFSVLLPKKRTVAVSSIKAQPKERKVRKHGHERIEDRVFAALSGVKEGLSAQDVNKKVKGNLASVRTYLAKATLEGRIERVGRNLFKAKS